MQSVVLIYASLGLLFLVNTLVVMTVSGEIFDLFVIISSITVLAHSFDLGFLRARMQERRASILEVAFVSLTMLVVSLFLLSGLYSFKGSHFLNIAVLIHVVSTYLFQMLRVEWQRLSEHYLAFFARVFNQGGIAIIFLLQYLFSDYSNIAEQIYIFSFLRLFVFFALYRFEKVASDGRLLKSVVNLEFSIVLLISNMFFQYFRSKALDMSIEMDDKRIWEMMFRVSTISAGLYEALVYGHTALKNFKKFSIFNFITTLLMLGTTVFFDLSLLLVCTFVVLSLTLSSVVQGELDRRKEYRSQLVIRVLLYAPVFLLLHFIPVVDFVAASYVFLIVVLLDMASRSALLSYILSTDKRQHGVL